MILNNSPHAAGSGPARLDPNLHSYARESYGKHTNQSFTYIIHIPLVHQHPLGLEDPPSCDLLLPWAMYVSVSHVHNKLHMKWAYSLSVLVHACLLITGVLAAFLLYQSEQHLSHEIYMLKTYLFLILKVGLLEGRFVLLHLI